jgi:hypothetical protein
LRIARREINFQNINCKITQLEPQAAAFAADFFHRLAAAAAEKTIG